jgi:hypothetical protein
MKKYMTVQDFIDRFSLWDSEWAQEWMEDNGQINTIEKLRKFLVETYDNPFEYLFQIMTEELE